MLEKSMPRAGILRQSRPSELIISCGLASNCIKHTEAAIAATTVCLSPGSEYCTTSCSNNHE